MLCTHRSVTCQGSFIARREAVLAARGPRGPRLPPVPAASPLPSGPRGRSEAGAACGLFCLVPQGADPRFVHDAARMSTRFVFAAGSRSAGTWRILLTPLSADVRVVSTLQRYSSVHTRLGTRCGSSGTRAREREFCARPFGGPPRCFPRWPHHFSSPPVWCWGPAPLRPQRHSSFSVFLTTATPVGAERRLAVALIGISLMTDGVELLPRAHLPFVCPLNCTPVCTPKRSVCSAPTRPLSDARFADNFLPFRRSPFSLSR